MNKECKPFLDMVIPQNIFKNKEVFNYVLLYSGSDNTDTKEYYKAKVLNSLTDTDILSIYLLNRVLGQRNDILMSFINKHNRKLVALVNDNIVSELGVVDYGQSFVVDFDFEDYIKDIVNKPKYTIVNMDIKQTILTVDTEYLKYLVYVNINNDLPREIIMRQIMKNNNIDVYNNGITNMLSEGFHNSDVPTENDSEFYLLHSFMLILIENVTTYK